MTFLRKLKSYEQTLNTLKELFVLPNALNSVFLTGVSIGKNEKSLLESTKRSGGNEGSLKDKKRISTLMT